MSIKGTVMRKCRIIVVVLSGLSLVGASGVASSTAATQGKQGPAHAASTTAKRNCTRGYKPCLKKGPSDYDCYGGGGNGPAYTKPGVVYHVSGSDPYRLDADDDGLGCE